MRQPKPEAVQTRPRNELQHDRRDDDRFAEKRGRDEPTPPGCDFSVLLKLGLL